MSEIPTEINITSGLITIGILLVFNAILALAEVALISARKARIQNEINKGDKRAKIAMQLVENPNQFLSVIQIGITSIDLLTGAITGATIGAWVDFQLEKVPVLEAYSEVLGILIGVLPITYLSLVLGELVPKRLAMRNPEGISSSIAGSMLFLQRLFHPW